MADHDQKYTNHNKVVDCHGLEKVLVLLQDLKRSPSGSVLYHHIERLVLETEQIQSRVTRSYASLVLILIDTYRRQLPRDSRLYLELKLVQQRLTPPISLNELSRLEVYMKSVARILGKVADTEENVLREALAPLLDDDSPAEQVPAGDEPAADQSGEPGRERFSSRASIEQHVTSVYRSRLDRQRQDIERIQQALIENVEEAGRQQERVAVLLDSVLAKLRRMNKDEDFEHIHRRLIEEVGEAVSSQDRLTGVLSDSRSLLSKVDHDSERLRNELNQVRVLSLTDELTQLPNRRAFLRRLEDEIGRSQRDKSILTLGMLDLDYFKEVNDQYGHNVGDEILRIYTCEILSMFRRYDMVARYGGEEFAILLPSTDKEGALHAFQKVRGKAAKTHCMAAGKKLPVPTFSAGLAVYRTGEAVQALIDRADKALYKAKQSGRDRIIVGESHLPEDEAVTPDLRFRDES